MTIYDSIAGTNMGRSRLAAARLRRSALKALRAGLAESDMTQSDLAKRLGVRKSAVGAVLNGTGNLQLNTLSDYLDALGLEAEISWASAGTARQKRLERRRAAGYRIEVTLPTWETRVGYEEREGFHASSQLETTMDAVLDSKRTDFAMAA